MTTSQPTFSLPRQLAYACGQAGNVLTESLIVTYLIYFFIPPAGKGETQAALLPSFVFWIIPAMGFTSVIARGIDTFLDPLVGNLSDRNTHPLGRRRFFMVVGCLPLCVACALAFFPPDGTASYLNVAWLSFFSIVYFAAFSAYVAPYLALLPELAPDPALKVRVSTIMAAFALGGGLIAINGGGLLISILGDASAAEKHHSTQMMVVILSIVGFVLLVIPILAIPERKLVPQQSAPAHAGLFDSLRNTFSDKAFIPYVIGTTLFAFGFNIVRSGLLYFVTVLMQEPEKSPVSLAVFGVSAVAFPIVAIAAGKLGKRTVMLAGTVIMAIALAGFYFITNATIGAIFFALSGLGLSTFLALPNAILSDICTANAKRTGQQREAMFFGAQGFLQKVNLGVSTMVLGFLVETIGSTVENPLGVRLAGPVAAVALIGAAIAYSRYPEKRITEELNAASPG